MKIWKVKLTAGVQTQEEVTIQRSIFKKDLLSRLLFPLAMLRLNYILRKFSGRYKFTKSQKKINHLVFIDIKVFVKNEHNLETSIQTNRI